MAHLERPPIALGFSFDGVDDYVEVPHDPSLEIWTGSWTIAFWYYREKEGGRVLFKYTGGGSGYVRVDNWVADRVYIILYDGTSVWSFWVPSPMGKWNHIAITHESTTKTVGMYVNSTLAGQGTHTLNLAGINPLGSIVLGHQVVWAPYYEGIIGEVPIYNRVLSAGEIGDLYSIRRNIMDGCVLKLGTVGLVRGGGTQWLDESPYKNHGTVYGAKRVRCCHCNVVRDYGA